MPKGNLGYLDKHYQLFDERFEKKLELADSYEQDKPEIKEQPFESRQTNSKVAGGNRFECIQLPMEKCKAGSKVELAKTYLQYNAKMGIGDQENTHVLEEVSSGEITRPIADLRTLNPEDQFPYSLASGDMEIMNVSSIINREPLKEAAMKEREYKDIIHKTRDEVTVEKVNSSLTETTDSYFIKEWKLEIQSNSRLQQLIHPYKQSVFQNIHLKDVIEALKPIPTFRSPITCPPWTQNTSKEPKILPETNLPLVDRWKTLDAGTQNLPTFTEKTPSFHSCTSLIDPSLLKSMITHPQLDKGNQQDVDLFGIQGLNLVNENAHVKKIESRYKDSSPNILKLGGSSKEGKLLVMKVVKLQMEKNIGTRKITTTGTKFLDTGQYMYQGGPTIDSLLGNNMNIENCGHSAMSDQISQGSDTSVVVDTNEKNLLQGVQHGAIVVKTFLDQSKEEFGDPKALPAQALVDKQGLGKTIPMLIQKQLKSKSKSEDQADHKPETSNLNGDDGDGQFSLNKVKQAGESDSVIDKTFLLRTFGRFRPIARMKMKWARTEAGLWRQGNCGIVAFIKTADEDKHLALSHQMYKDANHRQALEHNNVVYSMSTLHTICRLEGFVSNRGQSYEDPIKELFYAVYIVSSKTEAVAELAATLHADLSQLQVVASFACPPSWVVKLIDPGSVLQETKILGTHRIALIDEKGASRGIIILMSTYGDATQNGDILGTGNKVPRSSYVRVAFIIDVNITSYLTMDSASPGLKTQTVTLHEAEQLGHANIADLYKDLSKLERTKFEEELKEFAPHAFSLRCVLECLLSRGIVADAKLEEVCNKMGTIALSNNATDLIVDISLIKKSGNSDSMKLKKTLDIP